MSYRPNPIDTAHVQLQAELLNLTERLAENAHNLWAKQRLADGWTLGPRRNDKSKTHPCLVPFKELPDSEKRYDRDLAMGTLKAILALGGTISAGTNDQSGDVAGTKSLFQIAEEAAASAQGIRRVWQMEDPNWPGRWNPPSWMPQLVSDSRGNLQLDDPFFPLGRAALEFGEAFLALDIVDTGIRVLQKHPCKNHKVIQRCLSHLGHVKALSLARTGSTPEAQNLLRMLAKKDKGNIEIAAALGRTFKDFAFATTDPIERRHCLLQAHDHYFKSYRHFRDYFPGINAATIALWLGRAAIARRLAVEVRDLCREQLQRNPHDYWATATLGETYLIERKLGEARRHYARARKLLAKSRQWANLGSTRKQARLIVEHHGLDFESLDRVFRFPTLIVFSGHMIDRPGRACPRFPPEKEPEVRALIRQHIHALNAGFGVCSGACGSDLIFIEEMLARGAQVHVVLPWRKHEFIQSSVDIHPGTDWKDRFVRNLKEASSVIFLSQQTVPRDSRVTYEYLNECISGLAVLRSKMLDAKLVPLAVWDGKVGDGPGGTSSFVASWADRGYQVRCIPLSPPNEKAPCNRTGRLRPQEFRGYEEITVSQGQHTIKTLLFADIVGYSKIPEKQLEKFASHILGQVSTLIAQGPERPILTNTWGDAVYLVFDAAEEAGRFALRLRELFGKKRKKERSARAEDLPAELNIRIALHTGPVLLCVDPIIRQMTFTGSHVSHAARIEPVVDSGEIWTSGAFAAYAALAELNGRPLGFGLDYLGQLEFAKNHGRYPLFRLRPL